jgi:hypothetical protein
MGVVCDRIKSSTLQILIFVSSIDSQISPDILPQHRYQIDRETPLTRKNERRVADCHVRRILEFHSHPRS